MNTRSGSRNWENDMGNIRREVGMSGSLSKALIMGVMLVVVLVGAKATRADGVPQFLNVQGVLYDNEGNPVNDNYDLTVSLYRTSTGGPVNLVFQSTFADEVVENGIFHVTLSIPTASGNPFVLYPELWLGIAVDGDDEMTPRQRLTSVGYAMQARHADEASKARDVFCDGDGDPLTNDPVPCVARGELEQTYALADGDQEALSAISLSTKCDGCVGSQHLANGTIATVDLGDGSVTTAKVANGTLLSEDIGDQQVLSVDIANGTILSEDIGTGEVKTLNILNGTILTEDLANLAVANAKLGADAVTTDKIQNGQVMTVDLADSAVINEKLADAAVMNRNFGEIIHQNHLPIAGELVDQRGTVIVGDYLSVSPAGVVAVNVDALNVDIDAGLPVGQNLVQWEDIKWKNGADKTGNWKNDTCTSGANTCLVIATTDEPRHGGFAIRFAGNGAWLYARDMIEVAPDREYFGRIRARNASSSTTASFLAGARAFDKTGASLGDQWFMTSEDGNPQLHSLGKTFSGFVAADGFPPGTRYIQPIAGMTGSNGQIDVDALEIFELTTANDVVCAGCVQSADIANGSLATDDLADGAVTSAKILDGTIQSADIGAGEVKTVNLGDGAVQTAKLAAGAVTNDKIGAGQVTSLNIQDGGVGNNDLGLGAVTSVKIGDGEVKTADLANGEVTSEKLQNGTVTTVDLAADAVTAAILADNSVDTAALQNGAVTGGKIAIDAVGASHIGTGQVTTDELLNGTIKAEDLSSELAWISGGDITVPNNKNLIFSDDATSNDAAWFTEATTGADDIEVRLILGFEEDDTERFSIYRYSDGAGTTKTKEHEFTAAGNAYHKGNLSVGGGITAGGDITTATGIVSGVLECPAGGCIDTDEIENGTIANDDISTTAGIAATKIQGEALTKATLLDGGTAQVSGFWNNLTVKNNVIDSFHLKDNAVTNAKMADNAVGTAEVQDGSLLNADLATDTITNTRIASGAVTSDEILDGTIATADLGVDSVDAAQIKTGAVGSAEILDGAVSSSDIGSNQVLSSHISPAAFGTSGVSTLIARADHAHDTDYVNASGDTMSGDLTVAHAADTKITVRSTNGGKAILALESTGVDTDTSLQLTGLDTLALKGANLVLDSGKSITSQNLSLAGQLICSDCVSSTNILDGTITSNDLTNAGIAKSKILGTALAQNDTFGGDVSGLYNNLQLGANVVGASELADNSVDGAALQADSVVTGKIVDGTILGTDLATDTITATQIATGAITNAELAANSVYTNAIQEKAVTATKLANQSVSGGQDSAGGNAIVDNSVTTYDIQDGTITATDLTSNFWSNLNTNFVVKDGKQLLFEDSDDGDRQAFFQEFSGAGALDLGLVLGNNNSDLADQTFTVYSTDGATRVQRHQFRANGTAQLNGDVTVGDPNADLTAGERARIATYSTPRGDLIVTGAIVHPKDSAAGNGTALAVADVFEIRSGAIGDTVGHGFLSADPSNIVLSAGANGAGTLTLNRKDAGSAGNVVTGGNLVVGGALQCASASGDCVVGTSAIANGTVTTDDILNDTLTAVDIAGNAIGASELADASVDTNALQNNVVTTDKILNATILGVDLATDTLTATQIAANAIGTSELADGAVDTGAIADNAVTTAKIFDGQVNSAKILDNSVTTADIQNLTILGEDIADNTIPLVKILASERPIGPGKSLYLNKLSNEGGESLFFSDDIDGTPMDASDPYMREVSDDAAVGTDVRLVLPDSAGDDAFTLNVNNTIGAYKHKFDNAGNAWHTGTLAATGAATIGGVVNANGNIIDMNTRRPLAGAADGSVLYLNADGTDGNTTADYTSVTIGSSVSVAAGTLTVPNTTGFSCTDCINATAIVANAVGTSEITDASITGGDIAGDTITGAHIAAGAIGNGELADNSVNSAKIADNTVTATDIADGTITDTDINATANIGRAKIAGGALTGNTTFAGAATRSYNAGTDTLTLTLNNNVVGTSQITDGAIVSADILDNSIETGDIKDGTITTNDLAFTIPAAGSDMTLTRGKKFIFGTDGDNDGAFFQETSPLAVDNSVEVSLNFSDDGDTSERFVINSNGASKHWLWANGDAKHQGHLTTVGNVYAQEGHAYTFKDRDNPSTYFVDPSGTSQTYDTRAYIFRDMDDPTNRYLNPNDISQVNDMRAVIFRDLDDPTNRYVDPHNVSQTNDMRADIFRDVGDPSNYYANLNDTSRLNVIDVAEGHTRGWWRNTNAGHGLYNTATARHFYSQDATYWRMSSNNGMVMYDGANSTVRGYLYHDGSLNVGLLSSDGNWQVRAWNAGVELYDTTYMADAQANIFYDRQDTGYYADPNATSRLYHGRFNYITTGEWGNYNQFHTWTHLNGAYGFYSATNGAHFSPNDGTYGSWRVRGSRGSWYGLEFDTAAGNTTLMMGTTGQGWGSQTTGLHNNGQGWLWRFEHRTLYADAMVDNNNNAYKIDPDATSQVLDVNAQCVARGGGSANAGCPNGWYGAGDFCISGGLSGNNSCWREAVKDCANRNAHLCRSSEIIAARMMGQPVHGDWLWTSDTEYSVTSGHGWYYPRLVHGSSGDIKSIASPSYTYADPNEYGSRPWVCCISK